MTYTQNNRDTGVAVSRCATALVYGRCAETREKTSTQMYTGARRLTNVRVLLRDADAFVDVCLFRGPL